MPIPNVCMAWARRQAECPECHQMIEVATPTVRVFFWNKGDESKRSYNVTKLYHPQCWIQQGLDYLMTNPYTPGESKRGPKVELSAENTRNRQLLLRRYATYQHRKRNLKGDLLEKTLAEIKLDGQIASVILEISKIGGVPKRWIDNMLTS